MRSFRCLVGIHDWGYHHIGPWDGMTQDMQRQCERCGKWDSAVLINPISGPLKGKVHSSLRCETSNGG